MAQQIQSSIQELEDQHGAGTYHKRKLVIVRGQGARLWSEDDREYIDCIGGQGAANVGHQNPYVNRAIQEQSQKLVNCTELFYNDQRALLLERLARLTPPRISRFFFCNSGAEAIEGAFKFARLATGRTDIVATMRGYHGKSMGALSATWNKEYREPFEPLVPGFSHVPFDNLEKTCQAITEKTAAFIVELVQGESGVRPGSRDYFLEVEAQCRKTGTLLILDEVQTGFCRTGKMFALEHFGIEPDILCLAKSLGGGIPMGAIGISEAISTKLFKLAHTSTFGGNPLACAAANAAIQYMEDLQLARRAEELGQEFMAELRKIKSPKIREVRGMGLIVGIELKEKAGPYIQQLMEQGILALGAGPTVIRYLPPLVIERDDLRRVAAATAEVLR
ncbi:MAG: aspartate aminotransferase family protein [Acidobacteria bacterium]|nr:aspartate aminotransferase family protein [Acidobacteriota bacterium]